jgi:hypothetical protein
MSADFAQAVFTRLKNMVATQRSTSVVLFTFPYKMKTCLALWWFELLADIWLRPR